MNKAVSDLCLKYTKALIATGFVQKDSFLNQSKNVLK